MQDPKADHIYESEDDTLSLCDLPLCTHQETSPESQQDPFAQSQESSLIPTSKRDYFEFSSPSAVGYPPENFIFCGKIITEKKKLDNSHKEAPNPAEDQKMAKKKKNRGWDFIRSWMLRPGTKGTTLMHKDQPSSINGRYNSKKQEKKKYDFPVRQMSLSPGKARWYEFFLFGISRFSSSEVELREIKNRLSSCRHHRQSLPPEKGGPGLSRMIRLLSCSCSHHPNTMVVKSTRDIFDF